VRSSRRRSAACATSFPAGCRVRWPLGSSGCSCLEVEVQQPSILKTGRLRPLSQLVQLSTAPLTPSPTPALRSPARAGSFPGTSATCRGTGRMTAFGREAEARGCYQSRFANSRRSTPGIRFCAPTRKLTCQSCARIAPSMTPKLTTAGGVRLCPFRLRTHDDAIHGDAALSPVHDDDWIDIQALHPPSRSRTAPVRRISPSSSIMTRSSTSECGQPFLAIGRSAAAAAHRR
jgi:hypothetical protein